MIAAAEELGKQTSVRRACHALSVSRATLYRHRQNRLKKEAPCRRTSHRRLSDHERNCVKDYLYSEACRDLAVPQAWARLLDSGKYYCSIRTMYRILKEDKAVRERRNQLTHPAYKKPELLATKPNEVWSWDITKLLGPEKWTHYHLYVIIDIFSRYTVGWMLAHRESMDLASRLIGESAERQNVDSNTLTLHSDRGPSMTSLGVAQLLARLGVTKSHSRPHVSNDNPFSESQFKTMKYRPDFPTRFDSYDHAHGFCRQFFDWYNEQHYHSSLKYLTPASVHYGQAKQLQANRQLVMNEVYARHPERFPMGMPKVSALPKAVWINPPIEEERLAQSEDRASQ